MPSPQGMAGLIPLSERVSQGQVESAPILLHLFVVDERHTVQTGRPSDEADAFGGIAQYHPAFRRSQAATGSHIVSRRLVLEHAPASERESFYILTAVDGSVVQAGRVEGVWIQHHPAKAERVWHHIPPLESNDQVHPGLLKVDTVCLPDGPNIHDRAAADRNRDLGSLIGLRVLDFSLVVVGNAAAQLIAQRQVSWEQLVAQTSGSRATLRDPANQRFAEHFRELQRLDRATVLWR